MDEPAHGHSRRLILVGGLRGLFSHPALMILSLDTWPVLWQLSHSKYISSCASRSRQALNGSVFLLVTGYLTWQWHAYTNNGVFFVVVKVAWGTVGSVRLS